MEYNDNDYEGNNLHLAGEESSKNSSTLRAFVIPKFDFDDSLHGNLRFDSLVDNEAFLGIPSQDDNQWIEDFSRGSSGIQFCSSTTVSCALPRCNNVWSEATSSESVEMLLKAVGQEEMIPGESLVKELDLGDRVDSTGQMGTNVRQDDKINDVDCVNPLLPPEEAEQSFFTLNQSEGIEGGPHDAEERNLSSYGVSVDDNESCLFVIGTNLSDVRGTCEDKGEKHDLVNDSLSEQVQENLSVSDTGIDNVDNACQEHAGMLVDQDNIRDVSFASSNFVSAGIGKRVDEQEDLNANDETFRRNTVQTADSEQGSFEFPPVTDSLNEEHLGEIQVSNFGETSSMPETRESVSVVKDCGKVAFDVESAVDRGCTDGPDIKGSDDTPKICVNIEPKQVSVTQSSNQPESHAGNEDIYPGSSSSLEAPLATFESSIPCKSNSYHADGPDNSLVSSFAGGTENSGIERMREVIQTDILQKDSLEQGDHVSPPLLDGNKQKCGEDGLSKQADDDLSMQADVQGGDLNVSACEKDGKLPAGVCNVVPDDHVKEAGFEFSCEVVEVNVASATGSQFSASAGDHHVSNTEVDDVKLKSSCPEGEVVADCRVQNSPSIDVGYSDQNKELDAAIQPSTLSSTQSLDEVATGTKLENNKTLDSVAAVGRETDDPPVSLVEMPHATTPDAATLQLSEKVEHPANDSIVLNDVSETELTEKKTEAKIENSSGANASKVSDSSSAAEIEESNQPGAPSNDLTGQAQSELNKTDGLERDAGNVGDVLPAFMSSGVNVLSKQDETFTFDVRSLGGQSTEDSDKCFQQNPRIQTVMSLTGEGSPSTSGSRQKETGTVTEISLQPSSRPSNAPPSEGVKSYSDRKPRRRSSKSGKESAKKGNLVKETILSQQTERLDKSSTFLSPLGAGQLMTFDGALKPIAGISVSTSSLLDLNTSGPSSAFLNQPFTDLQQVQLRAQIFVYGSLIQGAAPDEACMVSAFGMSDGGRSIWEPSWRACMEKRHDTKYLANKTETPLQSRSGAKATDQTSTQGFSQSEVLSTPIGQTNDKAAPSPLANLIIPLSSPLWNISTPYSAGLPSSSITRFDYQGVSPLHPYQTPPVRNFMAHTTPWPSQAPYPVPWLASSKSSPFDIRGSYSASPIMEPVKLTPIKESSLHFTPAGNYVPHVPAIHTGATTVFAGTPTHVDLKKVAGSTSQTPAETKTRKRKKSSAVEAVNIHVTASRVDTVSTPAIANHLPVKVPAVEDLNQISFAARNQADSVSTTIKSNYSTPVTVPTDNLMPESTPNHIFSVAVPSVSSDHQRGELRVDKMALNLESFSKVEEAKLQAEQAATLAAEAVGHCQSVWSKLDQQKSAGMTADAESKLASAAVAIAAAASVAKAAAAAAKIASNAAAQAKQMADEAVTTHGNPKTSSYNTDFASISGNVTPLSTFWGGDSNNASTLAISSAREAARKRVEAASAASRLAENLDAIVKAAELAAEAVSHTGKIVGMGDPFSLNELVKAGPEGYWKISNVASASGSELKDMNKSKFIGVDADELPSVSRILHGCPDKDVQETSHVVSPIQTEVPRNIVNDSTIAEENPISSVKNVGKSLKPQKDIRAVDRAEVLGLVSESDVELRSSSFIPSYESNNASIQEGAAVEVLKDFGDVKKGWFSGSVLSLKDDKALVCYIELQSDEGSEPLEEWVSLEARGGKAPLIRIPHPMTALRFNGTRKRRRSAIKDYAWSVGDRVDVLVKDCWRESVIVEKNNKDPTTLTVKTPAEEMLTVKAWHLRPTLIWRDSQWSECSRQGENDTSQGETPAEKRPKLGSTGVESKGKGKTARKIGFPEAGRTEEPKLPLSTNESVFNIGSMKGENKVRTMRSGLQKEGPRVVFGVPKPGKKRKFMEVSKHYDSERPNKTSVPNNSVKSAKKLMPLGFGSRSSKNNSKVDFKEKQVLESKPRAVRSGKPPIPTRPFPRKGDSTSSRPNTNNATSSNDDNESGERNVNDSNVEETSKGTFVFTSQAPPTESRKKAAIRNTKPEQHNRGKLLPSSGIGKLAKTESHEKSDSEVSEPRRSNRRIQPTSRLLEGLQSSLVTPKFPSSHEKRQRSHRGTSKRE